MNLQNFFTMQKQLDDYIEQHHPAGPYEDRLSKRIIAFMVELGELANELPEMFKFWSNKKNQMEKALVEYVDGLHFLISIGLQLYEVHTEVGKEKLEMALADVEPFKRTNLKYQFEDLFYKASRIRSGHYVSLLQTYLGLALLIGFTWEQVETAYKNKHAENIRRQDSGY